RENGDIIMANLWQVKRGQARLTAEDFYAPEGGVREIALDPRKSPQQNAAKYYKDYSKRRTAEQHLTRLIAEGEKELDYLDSVLGELELASDSGELAVIRQELADLGYIRRRTKEKRIEPKPLRFKSSSGFVIYVGRNNAANDKLTFKTALKSDVWLHTKDIHGSHVIISCEGRDPDVETIKQAAELAAWYSKARGGAKVPVDFTQVRFVKKPSGAKPGFVNYTNQSTVFVTPEEESVLRLRDDA
ncbi:MAG: NFACT family protein, partial [Abditibacteriota bacterium]|nr:NFACT family protein [Abditibacteriota bacterium]